MARITRLQREKTALVVVDMQEGFRPVLPEFEPVANRIATMVKGVRVMGVPVILTEQYPRGLGHTAPEILNALDGEPTTVEKVCFGSCGAPGFLQALIRHDVRQVVLCGIEAHICVTQTALELIERDFDVFVMVDGIATRLAENKPVAIERMTRAGVIVTSLEMALFELLGAAGTPEFKAVQALIK